jgi:hypothetical protein
MSPGEQRILEFISSRLESMLRRPAVWGSLLSVEERILQLLELRRVLLVPSESTNGTQRLVRTYTQFIARTLDNATAEPLAIQLERRGRSGEFASVMARFIETELATFLAEEHPRSDDVYAAAQPTEIEATARVLEALRMDAEARARRRPRSATEPIHFPDQKHS